MSVNAIHCKSHQILCNLKSHSNKSILSSGLLSHKAQALGSIWSSNTNTTIGIGKYWLQNLLSSFLIKAGLHEKKVWTENRWVIHQKVGHWCFLLGVPLCALCFHVWWMFSIALRTTLDEEFRFSAITTAVLVQMLSWSFLQKGT